MRPKHLTAVIKCKRYDTTKAALLAGDNWKEGSTFERQNRQTFLYRTPRGTFFFAIQSGREDEVDRIVLATLDQAIAFWELCKLHGTAVLEFAEAFPGVTIEEG